MAKKKLPLYKRIIEWILSDIKNKKLKPADKLPTEHEISKLFGVSRGTVRTALNMLCKNSVLEAVHGSGYYVSNIQDILHEPDKDYAVQQIRDMVAQLRRKGLSDNEIQYCFKLSMIQYDAQRDYAKIVVVECNPDIFPVFHRLLRKIPNIKLDYCMISSVDIHDSMRILNGADIILTTQTHYRALIDLRPDLLEKIYRYNISISQSTLRQISSADEDAEIGIVCISQRFAYLATEAFVNFGFKKSKIHVNVGDVLSEDFISHVDCLVIPVDSPHYNKIENKRMLKDFEKRNGSLIIFDYQIEKGSMAHIEEEVARIVNKQKAIDV